MALHVDVSADPLGLSDSVESRTHRIVLLCSAQRQRTGHVHIWVHGPQLCTVLTVSALVTACGERDGRPRDWSTAEFGEVLRKC